MAWLERNQSLVLAAAILLLLAGIILRDLARSSPPALVLQDPVSGDGRVVVHVAGAVESPGLYELAAGARVIEAIEAAGGPVEGATIGDLNLARRLRDGERIDLPGAEAEVAAAVEVPALTPGVKLDLNSATAEELQLLPGIGEAYSSGIIVSRNIDGPYQSVDDLITRRLIPSHVFESVRDLLTVSTP